MAEQPLFFDLGKRPPTTRTLALKIRDEGASVVMDEGDAGVNAGVLMAPVVPGFTTQPAKLEATIKAIADHGAAFMGANLMYLKGGTKDHFMGFLAKEFPHMVEGYNRLYAGAYAKSEYVSSVRAMISLLQNRYDLDRRRRGAPGETDANTGPPQAEQAGFEWEEEKC